MSNNGQLDFTDLLPQEVPVKNLFGKDYLLREACGAVATRYRKAALTGTEMTVNDDDNTRTVKRLSGAAEVEALLVSLCLFPVIDGTVQPKPVDIKVVEGWPARVQKQLFEKCKEISDLDENETLETLQKQRARIETRIAKLGSKEADLKNLQTPTMVG